MFELEYLDLSNFNTYNAIDIGYMFNECHKLKEIKGISNFDLTNIRNKNKIFDGCNFLNQLIFLIFHSADYSIYFFIPCFINQIILQQLKKNYLISILNCKINKSILLSMELL